MIISDATPVQFWLDGIPTFNEKIVYGKSQVCFYQPWQCSDLIVIQIQENPGLTLTLKALDDNDLVIGSVDFDEYTTGVYLAILVPDDEGICEQQITLQIRSGGTTLASSDPLNIAIEHEGTVLIAYSNHRNYAGLINSNISPDTTFYIRIPAVFNDEQFPDVDEVMPLSNNRIISLNSQVKKQRLLETDQMPNYMHLKMLEVLKQQFVTIDAVDYIKEEPYQQVANAYKKWPLRRYTCWLTEKEYIVRNIL